MDEIFENKTILLTGGTGSFGNKFSEVILEKYNPHSLRIFSRGEKKQLDMMKKFKDERLRFFIGDVRDKRRLDRAMNNVDIVVHAAALKQIVTCEYNPIEAIKTNVEGTINIIDCAIDNEVNKVMSISTDKAVHPVNLYGATKMTTEKLIIQGNSYTGLSSTKLSCIRYGNVIGSRGSVIPLFIEQKQSGSLTITDERMTRFWITLEKGVNFVIDCIKKQKGGEIFIPKIPSMKITDMAEAIAPNVNIRIVGIRPGEKIHETLLTEDEARHSLEFKNFFIIEPEHSFWQENNHVDGKKLEEGFSYTSDNNTNWLSKLDIVKMMENMDFDNHNILEKITVK